MRPILIAYDIQSDKTRRRVLKILKGWRLDGQKSVHECRLAFRAAEELFIQLSENLDPKTDVLMMAWLAPHRRVLSRGVGRNGFDKRLIRIG